MTKFSSPAAQDRGTTSNSFADDTARQVIKAMEVELSPHMSRYFDEDTIQHIKDVVLQNAITQNNVELVKACEDVLAEYGFVIPNRVSGRWQPADVPRNEMMVREMYAHRLPEFGYQIVRSRSDFPDWLLLDTKGQFVFAEVEHRSSGFKLHSHNPTMCDLVVCWEHDCPEIELPVLEFFSERIIKPAKHADRGDKSRLLARQARRGLERTRRVPEVGERQKYVLFTYDGNVRAFDKKSVAMRKTVEQTGYSARQIYYLLKKRRARLAISELK